MARISTYQQDINITGDDKVIGSDSVGSITKNFPLDGLGAFFSRINTVAGQVAYQFVTLRKDASLTGPADGADFADVTTFKLSEIDSNNHNLEDFLPEYANTEIIVVQIDNKNNYGIFRVNSVVEDSENLNYYDFSLDFLSGNGSLILDKYYLIAFKDGGDKHYSHNQSVASATWTVAHNLDKFPSVTVVLSTGQKGYGDVTYVDSNNLTISFAGLESGKAYIN